MPAGSLDAADRAPCSKAHDRLFRPIFKPHPPTPQRRWVTRPLWAGGLAHGTRRGNCHSPSLRRRTQILWAPGMVPASPRPLRRPPSGHPRTVCTQNLHHTSIFRATSRRTPQCKHDHGVTLEGSARSPHAVPASLLQSTLPCGSSQLPHVSRPSFSVRDRRGPHHMMQGGQLRQQYWKYWKHQVPASLQMAGRCLRGTSAEGQVKPRPQIPGIHSAASTQEGGLSTPHIPGQARWTLVPSPITCPGAWPHSPSHGMDPHGRRGVPFLSPVSPPRCFRTHETGKCSHSCVTVTHQLQVGQPQLRGDLALMVSHGPTDPWRRLPLPRPPGTSAREQAGASSTEARSTGTKINGKI